MRRRLAADAGWKVDSTGDLARVLRLPGTMNTKADPAVPVRLAPTTGPRYTFEQLEQIAGDHLEQANGKPEPRPAEEYAALVRDGVDVGERHERIWQLAGYLLRRDIDPEVALELVQAFNVARIRPPYNDAHVERLFDGIVRLEVKRRREAGVRLSRSPRRGASMSKRAYEDLRDLYVAEAAARRNGSSPTAWPAPLGEDAFHGLPGRVVSVISPHSEADPAALLVQFLIAFGNVVGRGPHYLVEATELRDKNALLPVHRNAPARRRAGQEPQGAAPIDPLCGPPGSPRTWRMRRH